MSDFFLMNYKRHINFPTFLTSVNTLYQNDKIKNNVKLPLLFNKYIKYTNT